jgi:hypothetical protein
MIDDSDLLPIEAGDCHADVPPVRCKRAVGRPRRLTLDAIVDAACAVGIDRLDMCLVAHRLNTAVATLYGYVRGRDHLMQLVADRMASQAMVDTGGGTWQEVLRGHAALCFAMFKAKPEMIGNLVGGEKTADEVTYAMNIIAMLVKRGLPHAQAYDVYVETNQAVIGAAVMLVRRRLLANAVDADGNPLILPATLGDYRPTLERIVRDCEALLSPASLSPA